MARIATFLVAACLGWGGPLMALAQEGAAGPLDRAALGIVVTLNQEKLFQETTYGKAVIARFDADKSALQAENRRIEAELEAEERELTKQRAEMPPEAFTPLAAAFDSKVVAIRERQDRKSEALALWREQGRQEFFKAAASVLADLLAETGAVAILANDAVVLSLSSADITDLAIQRIDERMPSPPLGKPPVESPQ